MKIFLISAGWLPATVEASVSIIVIVEAVRSLDDDCEGDHSSDDAHIAIERNHMPEAAMPPHYTNSIIPLIIHRTTPGQPPP